MSEKLKNIKSNELKTKALIKREDKLEIKGPKNSCEQSYSF